MNMQIGTAKGKLRRTRKDDQDYKSFLPPRYRNIVSLFQAVLLDITTINPSYRLVDSARDLATIEQRLKSEGLGFLSTTLPALMSDLFLWAEGGEPLYLGFKKRGGVPCFLGRLFQEVYADGKDKETAFGSIYQICYLFKKLKGPFRQSDLAKNIAKFRETDLEVGFIDYNSEPLQPIISNARRIIETVFADVDPQPGDIMPRPGSGATNTPVDKHLRFRPHTVYSHLNEEFDYLEYFYTHSWDPHEDALRYMNLPIEAEAISRYKQIPKYLLKPRGICIEENEMQFFQQGWKRLLYSHLEKHPWTRGRINFTLQEINQLLALESSLDQTYGTIDMSEGSDRHARELVFRLTWDTVLEAPLDALSTRLIQLPDGDIMPVHKFAPMGSGVCFPIMALVHWALIVSIIQLSTIEDSFNLSKEVYVYGDDIIIPSQTVEAVYTYLPLFGMKINTDKSFYKGFFRESCGIHAYYGVDVTPVYVNHVPEKHQAKSDTNVLLSLIAKEAQFHNKGYHETSQCIKRLVEDHYWSLPEVGSTSPVLGFKRDGRTTNESIDFLFDTCRKVRYDDDLHTLDLNLQVVVPRRDPTVEMTEGEGYLRKLLTQAENSCTVPGEVEDLTVRRRWVSLEAI